jgi:hypothetical protein
MDPLAVGAITGGGAVLGEAQRHGLDLDLLHDAWRAGGRLQAVAAGGAQFQRIAVAAAVEQFGGKELPQVTRMAGLAAAPAFAGAVGRRGLGRLNQIGGRRLGGGRGIFAGLRQLFLELDHRGLQGVEAGLQLVQLRSQALTARTGGRRLTVHAKGFYDSSAPAALPA